ncbi:hypothetical protein AB1Y20_003274 [Prymnesium parvum]|uniref:Uncharacterized protein n=1 Tax=Prymnesium parvum TaxID=97485 RepID=A0AB34JBG0_PRYPA|mmetsp:Transcript_4742/g.7269  ORF Transcript_4742/g.7269 Transcript_4742/m.7269 type:complete len:108 (-) Transcript_4742:55-378(-)
MAEAKGGCKRPIFHQTASSSVDVNNKKKKTGGDNIADMINLTGDSSSDTDNGSCAARKKRERPADPFLAMVSKVVENIEGITALEALMEVENSFCAAVIRPLKPCRM